MTLTELLKDSAYKSTQISEKQIQKLSCSVWLHQPPNYLVFS
jgi:hypothetical protein